MTGLHGFYNERMIRFFPGHIKEMRVGGKDRGIDDKWKGKRMKSTYRTMHTKEELKLIKNRTGRETRWMSSRRLRIGSEEKIPRVTRCLLGMFLSGKDFQRQS